MLLNSIRPTLLSSSLTPEGVDRLTTELRAELKEPRVKQFSQVRCLTLFSVIRTLSHSDHL